MKHKLLKVSVFLFAINSLFGQTVDCSLLKAAVETEHFKREFLLCKNNRTLFIFDKKKVFTHCSSFEVCGNSVFLTQDTVYSDLSPEKHGNNKYPDIIVLYNIVIKKKNYSLMFWRPYSGANLILTFKKKKNSYKLSYYEIGTF